MNYSLLVKEVASKAEISQTDAKRVLDSLSEVIVQRVSEGDEVPLNRVGKFVKVKRSSRSGVNPITKERITIPEHFSPMFKISSEFKNKCK